MLIMLCIHLTTTILFCAQASHIYCLTPKNMETRESYLILNSNGTLKYTSKVPDCGSGGKIFLMSYSYQQIQCDNDCYSVHEEPLLPNDIMLLHEMCSMKEKCQNLTFGVRTEGQRNRINSVKITFRCLDHTSTSIDICKPCTVLFNDTLYLTTSGDSARLYRMCECFVHLDTFSIKAEDIRLNSIQEKKCTNAVVHINQYEFKCDAERGSFDAVFKRTVVVSISNAYLSLIPKSATELPSMVLITVSPKRTSRIVCIPKPSRSGAVTLSFARTTKPAVTVKEVTNSVSHKDTERSTTETNHGDTFKTVFIVAITLFAVSIWVTLLLGFCFITTRKKLKKYQQRKANDSVIKINEPHSNLNDQQQASGNYSESISLDDFSQPSNQEQSASGTTYYFFSPQTSERQHSPIRPCDTTSTLSAASRASLTVQMTEEQTYIPDAIYMHDIPSGSTLKKFFPMEKEMKCK